MYSVMALKDGAGSTGIGYYVLTPEGSLSRVFDKEKDAAIYVALMNFSLFAIPIEE